MGLTGDGALGRLARLAAVAAGGLLLANCSGGLSGRVDPRYGVSASARVVEPGEPVPKGGGVYRVGKPYVVAGQVYVPEADPHYSAVGLASWYGDDFHGRYTANGEIFDENAISAAHPTLPLPSYARVTNLSNNRSIIVRINDRGPYAKGRIIDLSSKAAELLRYKGDGVARVRVEYVGPAPMEGSDDRKLVATLREGQPAPAPSGILLASNSPFEPAARRGAIDYRRDVAPIPAERPYDIGRYSPPPAEETAPAVQPVRTARYVPAQQAISASAYAPVASTQPLGYASGRGLY